MVVHVVVVVGVSPNSGGITDATLHDDECTAHGSSENECAFNALQRRAAVDVAQHRHAQVPMSEKEAGEIGTSAAAGKVAEAGPHGFDLEKNVTVGDLHPGATGLYSCKFVPYSGKPVGAESCFCHKVANPTCVGKPCTCREGCSGFALESTESSTFINRASTTCKGAYLTIPRAYFTDIYDAKVKCGSGLYSLLKGMLQAGYTAYQRVQRGPVMQCVHKPAHVSVHWMHLHTFCKEGRIDGMPNRATAICEEMASYADAGRVAALMSRFR